MSSTALRLALLTGLSLSPAWAINDSAGTAGFSFLKIGVGARAAALGGAFTAVRGDLEAAAWNPAGVFDVGARSAAVSLTRYVIDTQAGFLAVALPSGPRMWALSTNYVSYGEMTETDADGQELGTFGAFDMATAVTAAQNVWKDRLTLGASAKWIYSSIHDYTSDAYAVDLGVLVRGPVSGMTIGGSLSNLGSVRSGFTDGYEDALPVLLRAGVTHHPAHFPIPLMLAVDFTVPNDNDPYVTLGAELKLAGGLYLRPGYSLRQEDDEALGLSTGGGLEMKNLRIDYAYSSLPALGGIHRLSLRGRI